MERDGGGAGGMRWVVVSVPVPSAGEEVVLVEALRRLGARLIEREGERVVAHLPSPPDPAALLAEVEAVSGGSGSWRWRSEEEWEARWAREVGARRVGDRIVVVPAGVPAMLEPREDDIVIRLAPGLAFGTAEHATTRACLRLLERRVRAGDRLVDVGAGSGILSIAAALLGARRVLALEADAVACGDARRNVALNGVSRRVSVREVEVGPREVRRLRRCDGVLANIEARVVLPLLPALARKLKANGWLLVSGILPAERAAVTEAARMAGLEPNSGSIEDGWWTGCFGRI